MPIIPGPALAMELLGAEQALSASHSLAGFRRSGAGVVMLRAAALRLLLRALSRSYGLAPGAKADDSWRALLELDQLEALRLCLSPAQRLQVAEWLDPSAPRPTWSENQDTEATAAVVLQIAAELLAYLLKADLADVKRHPPSDAQDSRER